MDNDLSSTVGDSKMKNADPETCTVRVESLDGYPQGTGFVLRPTLVVTCAHVVQACGAGPGDRVRLSFQAGGVPIETKVLADGYHQDADVAFLRLSFPLPDTVAPAILGPSANTDSHTFRALGYPNVGDFQGVWAEGKILGSTTDSRDRRILQLESQNIAPGMSGAPVLDVNTGRVVGMVSLTYNADGTFKFRDAAFAIPSEILRDLCTEEVELREPEETSWSSGDALPRQQAEGHRIAQADRGGTAIVGDENVVGNEGVTQVVKAGGNITDVKVVAGDLYEAAPSWWDRFRQRPLIFDPTLVLTVLVVVVILSAGLISMGADVGGARQQLEEWGLVRAFPPASENEILIVITSFYHSEGIPDTEAHNEIRYAIQEAGDELGFSHLRVEVEPTRLAADDRTGAEKLGERYNASIVIWGADTGVRVTVNFLNLKQPDFATTEVQICETERTLVANPSAYARFITQDLPGQLAFLSLFAVGQSYHVEEEYTDSIRVIEKAIGLLVLETEPLEGLAEAYFRLGWLYQDPMDDDEQAIVNYDQAIQLQSDFAESYNNRGDAHNNIGDYDRAIADLDQAIALKPDWADPYYNRGNVYDNTGDYDRAIVDYNRAIELQPDLARAYVNRGKAHRARGDVDLAIADYSQAIQLGPDLDCLPCAYNNLGNAYSEKGDDDQAIATFDKAIQLQPDFALAYFNRGNVYYGKGDYDQAIADYDQGVQFQPDFAPAYFNRGNIYAYQGDYDRAIADYDKAIELDPDFASAYFKRGFAYNNQGNYDRAIANYDRVIELKPDDPDYVGAYINRGLAYADQEDYDRAIADFDKAVELKPDLTRAYYNRGLAYADQGDYDRAIADYDQAIALDPDYAPLYNSRGIARAAQGDLAGAITDFDQASALDPGLAEAYNDQGIARAAQGDLAGAITDFDQAIALDPGFAEAYYNRGLARHNQGDLAGAIPDYDQAIALDPGFAEAYYNRGLARHNQGDLAGAIADYDQAIALDPDDAEAYNNRGLARRDQGDLEGAIADFRRRLELQPDADNHEKIEQWIAELEAQISEP